MVKSHTHPIGGSTGGATANISNNATFGAKANITSATHSHVHGATVVTNYVVGEGATYSGLPLSGGAAKDGSTNITSVSLGGPVNEQGVYDPNVIIAQNDHIHVIDQANHSHTLPANTASNDNNGIENRPTNYTVKIWKRTA